MNPLLDFSGLPRFADIRTEHITPAVAQLLTENRALIDKVREDRTFPTWDNFVQPITDVNERLSRTWGQVSHLNAVVNSPELREAYNANLPLVSLGILKHVRPQLGYFVCSPFSSVVERQHQ